MCILMLITSDADTALGAELDAGVPDPPYAPPRINLSSWLQGLSCPASAAEDEDAPCCEPALPCCTGSEVPLVVKTPGGLGSWEPP